MENTTVCTAVLVLLLGIAAPQYAKAQPQDQNRDRDQNREQPQSRERRAPNQGENRGAQPQNREQAPRQQPSAQPANPQQVPRQQVPREQPPRQPQAQEPNRQQVPREQAPRPPRPGVQGNREQVPREGGRPVPNRGEVPPPRANEQVRRIPQGGQRQVWDDHRANDWRRDHRTWAQRGGYHAFIIPQDRYRLYFGPRHFFRIYALPIEIIGPYPRFEYQGLWFTVLDPWPEYWSADWFDNDDLYINFIDGGYYLCNRQFPGDCLALEVSAG